MAEAEVGDYSFTTVHASVRPARVAMLAETSDPDWRHTAVRIIEFFCQLWGGAQNIIIPTDGTTIPAAFWDILEAFDPDYLYCYKKSVADLAYSHPEQYAKLIDNAVGNMQSGAADRVRQDIEPRLRRELITQFEVTASLQDQLKRRLAPFFFEKWTVAPGAISSDAQPTFPLTNLLTILPTATHPDRVTVAMPEGLPFLWMVSRLGAYSAETKKGLTAIGIRVEDVSFTSVSPQIDLALDRPLQMASPADSTKGFDFGPSPFALTMLELGLYRPLAYHDWEEPLVLVAGDTFEDFCLYYALSRVRGRVVWVLPTITAAALTRQNSGLGNPEFVFASKISSDIRFGQSTAGARLISHSLNAVDAERVTSAVLDASLSPFDIQTSEWNVDLTKHPMFANERDNFERDLILQLRGDATIVPFRTPKPKHFDLTRPYEHRWVTQLTVPNEQPPKHSELGTWIIRHPVIGTHEARIGKYGPAYFCPNVAYFGGDIDTVLTRPHLRFPSLYSILVRLASAAGYDCRPSDKGIYADESVAKWRGIEQITAFFRDLPKAALLNKYLDVSKSKEGEGVYLASDRRRYLDMLTIRGILGSSTEQTIDELVGRQILYRGFIFQCLYCRSADWFSVAEISQEFRCKRCGRVQLYQKEHWKKPSEPAWFYKLDEIVYQGHRNNMAVGLLAIDSLRRKSRENFMFSTEKEFVSKGGPAAKLEADFFCVSDGVLMIGEAKIEPVLGQTASEENGTINKYIRLARALGAREVAFVTVQSQWHQTTIERINTHFQTCPELRVRLLTSAELFGAPVAPP